MSCVYVDWLLAGQQYINPLNADLNPFCHLLKLLGAHHILHVSRIGVKFVNARQICRYKNVREELWKTIAAIWLNKTCRNKLKVNSASVWSSLWRYVMLHGHQNIQNCNEPSGSVKCSEFLDWLFKDNSAPWGFLVGYLISYMVEKVMLKRLRRSLTVQSEYCSCILNYNIANFC
jgi:hypothetical protein